MTAVSLCLKFWTFTLLIFYWSASLVRCFFSHCLGGRMGIVHFSMQTPSGPFKKVKIPFVVVNVLISLVTVVTVAAVVSDTQSKTAVLYGSGIVSGLFFSVVSVFFSLFFFFS